MEELETIQQYYELTCRQLPLDLQRGNGLTRHFNVFHRSSCFGTLPFRRRDYYKISLCHGKAVLYTEKGEVCINKPALLFSSPFVKFGWKNISEDQAGYVCVFNEVFVTPDIRMELKRLAHLFENDIYSFVELTDQEFDLFHHYFKVMAGEYKDCFEFKDEMIQHLMKLIILSAMKIRQSKAPVAKVEKHEQAVGRFLDLLDSQFPIDSPRHSINMRTPADFARELNVHINHLNHVIKANTGKTTGQLIAEKKIAEALSLLKNTDWTIAEIGFSLGFEYPQYFNIFFKRQTGRSPKVYRDAVQADI